jgi:uncharacterized protein YaaN involved in tellurite resistance
MGGLFMSVYKPTLQFDDDTTGVTEDKPIVKEDASELENSEQFSPEEQKQIDEFVEKIDLNNTTQILNYGLSAQKRSVEFSDQALKSVQTKDFDEVGTLLANMAGQIDSFGQEEKHGLKGFFAKKKTQLEVMKAQYATTEENLNKIATALDAHRFTLMKDIAMLDGLFEQNEGYFKELSMYIAAGKKKLAAVEKEDIPALQQKAAQSGLQEDAQKVSDLIAQANRFEKKVHDLELTRTVALQMAPQIRLVQNADTMMAEKIQSTIVNTLPIWKNQMVLALGVHHASKAAQAQKLVTDMTNQMLKENADVLKQTTIEAATANERSIVDLETLKHTNEALISTIDEVKRIQEEGISKRLEAEKELSAIESQLKQKLLEVSHKE